MNESEIDKAFPPFEGWRLCGHCNGRGTCRSGNEDTSCFVCSKEAGVADPQGMHRGLPCSVCKGHGCGAPTEVKTNRLMNAGVTIFFSFAVFGVLVYSFGFPDKFDKVLTFAGTIIGSITGFYFGGRPRQSP